MTVALAGASGALADCVNAGGVAVFPTDTVYGLCCDPQSAGAVRRLYELKARPPDKPAAILFTSLELALATLPELGERSRAAMCALLPGPATLLLANPRGRFPLAGGGALLGVRVIDIGLALPGPVLQSSANLAGGPDARRLADVAGSIRDGADLVIDGGELHGVASTVIDLGDLDRAGVWRVLRLGGLSEQAVAASLDAGKLESR
ncbi:MAG: Sua5/YciO/YrdC/YwlC family protein [Solirubrobacteraceae bacterium]|jgi:L-threonylcarbamoyladenylate synthase